MQNSIWIVLKRPIFIDAIKKYVVDMCFKIPCQIRNSDYDAILVQLLYPRDNSAEAATP